MFVRDYIIVYEKMRNLHKHRIGAFIYDKALSLAWYLKKANRYVYDDAMRVSYIEDYLDELDSVSNAIRLAHECRVIDTKTHARLSDVVVELGRQATAWKNKAKSPGCPQSTDSGRDAISTKGSR